VTRADDDRASVQRLREHARAVTRAAGLHELPGGAIWVPEHDPHREALHQPSAGA
jgi:hypothetical protein